MILAAVLDGFGAIWPSRMSLDGANLGDVWRHRGIVSGDLTSGLVPFHKLSQWLTRSEEHTSELQSLMRISYAVFCLKKKNKTTVTSTKDNETKHTNNKTKTTLVE